MKLPRDWGAGRGSGRRTDVAQINNQTGQVVIPGGAPPTSPGNGGITAGGSFGGGGDFFGGSGPTVVKPAGPKCVGDHDGDIVILSLANGATIRGADRLGAVIHVPDLILDLAARQPVESPFVLSSNPEQWTALNVLLKPPTVVSFDWPDTTAPHNVPLVFWERLLSTIGPKQRVVVACEGGHGRTGTALCAMLIATGWSLKNALDYVRDPLVHCPKAVETWSQMRYLERLEREARSTL